MSIRVAVATPLSEELCERIVAAEPRIELVRDQSLLPPMRWPGDHSGDPGFVRTPAQQGAFEALLDGADALYGVPGEDPAALTRTVRANPRLRWVQTMPAGGGAQVRAAKLTQAELDRIVFTTTAGVHGSALAEFAVFGILAGAKDLPRLLAQQADKRWPGRWCMRQVEEQTIAVLGMGHIGRDTAAKLIALGARVIGVSRHPSDLPGLAGTARPDRLGDVLATADALVVTLPGTEQTHKLVNADVLAKVKPGLTFVSVGRGSVIDEAALAVALTDGRIGFAAMDVFYTEPLPAASALWTMPNVLISPHTAALNAAEDVRIADLFARNATAFIDGEPLINVVNTVEFY